MSACTTALAGTIPAGLSPSLTLSQIHSVLRPSVGHGQNAAICLAYLDGPLVRVSNAGSVAPIVRRGDTVKLIEVGGLPLGTPLSHLLPYHEVEEQLDPGDMLILCSDGIVEAKSETGELYGFERFLEAIGRGPIENAQLMLAHLFADVSRFAGEAEMHDDMAMVVACYRADTQIRPTLI
jgi:serine phosphatase RsbU (regulator of sigma subunit)